MRMEGKRSSAKRPLVTAALLAASLMLSLGLAEVLLRLQEPHLHLMGDRAESALGRYAGHAVWHHWMRPGHTSEIPSIDPAARPDPIVYRTNSLGCRDSREFAGAAAAGTYRILVLGDSFTEGYYPAESFAGVLERELAKGEHAGAPQVINCGTSSYSPVLHYVRYTRQLEQLEPDEVIINVDLTDVFDDNVRYREDTVRDSSGAPISAGPARYSLEMVADQLRFRSYLARLLSGNPRTQFAMYGRQELFAWHNGAIEPASDEWREGVGYTIGLLEKLVERIRASGASVWLTVYPYREQFESVLGEPVWHRAFEHEVAGLARRKGVHFYSAFDDLKALHERGEPIYWSNNIHFSYPGQRAWAEAFARHYLRERSSEQ